MKLDKITHIYNTGVLYILLIVILVTIPGCRKLVEIEPPTNKITIENVFNDDVTAAGVMTGMYLDMSTTPLLSGSQNFNTLSFWDSLSADDMILWEGSIDNTLIAVFKNNLSGNIANDGLWYTSYNHLYTCNLVIEALNSTKSAKLSPAVKTQLMGEAKFMRALLYFYLVNHFGNVPLALTTDYTKNSSLVRTDKQAVYDQIVNDVTEAKSLLSSSYLSGALQPGTTERVRPTKWLAAALLARVYLYEGKWAEAETEASVVIDQSSLYNLVDINSVFLANNQEAIWQFQPNVINNLNPLDGVIFNLTNTGLSDSHPVYLSSDLLSNFESFDKRLLNWTKSYTDSTVSPAKTYYFPYKYKVDDNVTPTTEYQTLFRLADLYLIRAEARINLSKIQGRDDLNMIRSRAGASLIVSSDFAFLKAAILKERRLEFFTEMGHRWMDLKRTGNIDAVMSVFSPAEKASTWHSYQQLFPLSNSELGRAPTLTQTPGY
ncbi:RagB/SusD family nutrient uptake outer membrane protein [Mucilaginibacter paludis]|uniref:RagB/SusD domain-containing protein n=1 Tax=Mucilaginibacter paludis DSM 18603 TaxID=714943 RepID=H1YF54_9SPHI|nr:RagB/SusD family nutrient uptake outer membrane protein [Mucilaginibacter paludis]EHQ26193.1 RagB/SusD domain-containing protein [Mucilaginibacter paludis DSM 18603]